jgi:hypothetical protein
VLTVTAVNDLPAFTVSTNLVLVAEDAGLVTNASFLTGISAGSGQRNESVYTFTLTAGHELQLCDRAGDQHERHIDLPHGDQRGRHESHHGGDEGQCGGTTGGGKDSVTNTFSIGVTPANDAPTFTGHRGQDHFGRQHDEHGGGQCD